MVCAEVKTNLRYECLSLLYITPDTRPYVKLFMTISIFYLWITKIKDTFTPAFMTSDRTAQKLSSYLIRAKLYLLERTVSFRKCSEVCENVQNSHTFQSSLTSEMFKIKHLMTNSLSMMTKLNIWFVMTNA